MSCNDIASVLDTHRASLLKPAERAKIDAHLAACADCSAAWHAQDELLALRVPPVPSTLLERALLASRLPQSAPARRARMPVIIGSAVLAGAAAAAVTVSMMREQQEAPTVSSPPIEQSDTPATAPPVDEPIVEVDVAPAAPQGDGVTSVELVETGLDMLPLVRHPPTYPPEALAQRVRADVQVKFDVTAGGAVENVTVVRSSDERFEAAAVEAVAKWRYLPRIVAGKRVAAKDIRTVIRWEPPSDQDPAYDQRQADAKQAAAMRGFLAFSGDLEVALDRLAADDLRGAELQLDQMRAVYPAVGLFHGDISSFYGYLFTVEGNYDRAIDAYETALASYARNGAPPNMGPRVPLAKLYFARHQYDMAMRTLVQPNLPGGNRLVTSDAKALLQQLNALGVTEETL